MDLFVSHLIVVWKLQIKPLQVECHRMRMPQQQYDSGSSCFQRKQ
uniref:Uncharacterized protein n=1 Tax=Rhizophora mucronata TaxID=61149 RepID=A0A2P2QHB9_RHIMU